MLKIWIQSLFHWITYVVFRLLIIILENLPLRMAYALAQFVGLCGYYFSPLRRRRIEENLRIGYPQGHPFVVPEFTKQVFIHLIYMVFEFFLSRRLFHPHTWHQYIEGEGIDVIQKDAGQHPAVILCSAHLGSFMLLGHAICYLGIRLLTVVRTLSNPWIDSYIIQLFERSGHQIVSRENAYPMFLEAIPKGFSPGIVMDQHAGSKALLVKFMGKPAYTAASPAALARRFQIPIYVGVLFRKGLFRFSMDFKKVPLPPWTDDKNADLEKITQNLNDILEDLIKQHPEQWFWMHRRWREYEKKNESVLDKMGENTILIASQK